jgi:hypothetical protein
MDGMPNRYWTQGWTRTRLEHVTTTLSTTSVRRSTVVRWLAAMVEHARVSELNNPEFGDQIAA